MNSQNLRTTATKTCALVVKVGNNLQSPLLLVMRLWWGWSFMQTGWAKLTHHGDFVGRFAEWGIPFPSLNVWVAGSAECFGGLFLMAGFASRLTAIPLSITMIVAYLTADNEALKNIFSDTDKFTSATPFLFLLTCLIVLAFGPGAFSVDRLLARKFSPAPVNGKG